MGRSGSAMELSATLLVLLHLSMHVVDEGHAVNPSCSCIRYTSTYGKERGTFSSPDYPRPYPPHIDCLLYTFVAAPHEIVELVFTDFDIFKDHLDCTRGDYLKVYWEVQGPGPPGAINERSAWARELCGSRADAPPALYSPGPSLVLEFHTGAKQNNATGFVGTYSFIDRRIFDTDGVHVPGTECDFQFSRSGSRPTHGRLYSPRYPSIYPNNVRCSYHFHARPKERVKIVFEEVALQKGDISCLRRADIIKVFDGRDTNSPAIAMLCNELTGYEVLSTGPALLIQFTANSATPGQGFAATFLFQPPPDSTAADSDRLLKLSFGKAFESLGPEVSATTSSCHQEFSSDGTKHGTLTSPHYPSPYPPNTHCHYEFFGRGKERVRLIFQDFYLYKSADGSIDCTSVDSLQAFVNVDGRLEKVETFCGIDLPKPIMSNGPKLMLEFRGTQSSRYSRGFKISYSFVENFGINTGRQLKEFPCAFVYNSSEAHNGTFASPNSPGPYPRDTECTYFFHGGETEKVHLHFTNFDVEGVLPCHAVSASDYVEFSNYMTEDNRFGRYCGQMKEFHVESERNFFKVTFRSNDRLDGTGFKAIYQFLEATDEYRAPPVQDKASHSLCIFDHFLMLLILAIPQLHHQLYH
ncbi:suppressor of lurcher protein 1 [Spodoptera litura]|uniref:Suppressor of lurcher protein 1 n=1 Tax=Spodoptera litura TaxID=69820 RepID=A0A9J7ECV8_SPOLT|nr:suppressor of lurcher protein 1 [Spodoptera litura]